LLLLYPMEEPWFLSEQFEELGYTVDWNDATKTVTAKYKGNEIKLTWVLTKQL